MLQATPATPLTFSLTTTTIFQYNPVHLRPNSILLTANKFVYWPPRLLTLGLFIGLQRGLAPFGGIAKPSFLLRNFRTSYIVLVVIHRYSLVFFLVSSKWPQSSKIMIIYISTRHSVNIRYSLLA